MQVIASTMGGYNGGSTVSAEFPNIEHGKVGIPVVCLDSLRLAGCSCTDTGIHSEEIDIYPLELNGVSIKSCFNAHPWASTYPPL